MYLYLIVCYNIHMVLYISKSEKELTTMVDLLNDIQERTYIDLTDKLEKYGVCALIRCTGFGKTTMAQRVAKQYKNVLFLSPYKAVGHPIELESNVVCMTYASLVRLEDNEIPTGYDLLIFDECHRCGATLTLPMCNKLIKSNPGCKRILSTATPERTKSYNNVDVITELAEGITVFPYRLWESFKDEIVQRPYYCYYTYDVEASLKEAGETYGIKYTESQLKELVVKASNLNNIKNMDVVIKDACSKVFPDARYLKFIVFYSYIDEIKTKGKKLADAFKQAFPGWTIRNTEVHSKSEEISDVSRLNNLKEEPNTIDLIHSRDMLNQGYHSDSLSGIIMLRSTKSSIVYIQQIGRVLSVASKGKKLVLDFASNIKDLSLKEELLCPTEKPVYNLRQQLNSLIEEKRRLEELNGSKSRLSKVTNSIKLIKARLVAMEERYAKEQARVNGAQNTEKGKWWVGVNYLHQNDLIAISNEASDREFFDKFVLEYSGMSCSKAVNDWLDSVGSLFSVDFIKNPDKLKSVGYNLDFINKVNTEFINKGNVSGIPLVPYCNIYGVSIEGAIEYMKVRNLV